jgi:hypothetical protein
MKYACLFLLLNTKKYSLKMDGNSTLLEYRKQGVPNESERITKTKEGWGHGLSGRAPT